MMKIQPVKDEKSYEAALKRVEQLMNAKLNTPAGDELDVLATLIEAYEAKAHPIETPDPITAIHFRMEQYGMAYKDLEPFIGQSGRVSEVMNYHRRLSINMIRKLSSGLNIPTDSLIKEYELRG